KLTPPPLPTTLSLHDALPICVHSGESEGAARIGAEQADQDREMEQRLAHRGRLDGARIDLTQPLRGQERLPASGRDQDRVHVQRSEEHTSELQSREKLVCRLL